MTHVVITIRQDGEDTPFLRSKDYGSEEEFRADADEIMDYITSHII